MIVERAAQSDRSSACPAATSVVNAIATIDLSWNLTYVSDTLVQLWGYDGSGELLGRSVLDLFHQPRTIANALTFAGMRGAWAGEGTARKKDGSSLVVRLSAHLVAPVEAGRPAFLLVSFIDLGRRTGSEEGHSVSEEQLALAVEGSGVGLWDWMVQTGEATFDERWARIVGYSLNELAPASIETWSKLVHPDDLARSNELLQQHFAGESPAYECEARMKHKDGHWVWVLDRGKVTHRDAHGRPIRMAGTHLDITQRKHDEEMLLQAVHRLELLASSAEELLRAEEPQRIVESVCRVVMAQLDCHAFFNYLVEGAEGRLHLNACAGVPSEEARRIEWLDYGEAVCGCVARDGQRIVAEHIQTTADSRTDLVKSYGIKAYACHPLLGPGGGVIGTLSFGTRSHETFSEEDLFLMRAVADQVATAMMRLQSQRSLQVSERQYRTIVESAHEGIWQIGKDGRTTFVNPRMAEMLGTTVEEMAGKSFFDYMDDHRRAEAQTLLERRLQGKEEQHEFCFRRRDGSPLWTITSAAPIYAEDGTVASALAMVTDITQRKHDEEVHRTIVRTATDGFWMLDPQGRLIEVNDAYCEMSGYTRAELLRMTIADLEADESPQEAADHMRMLLERGHDRFETRHLRKDGRIIDVEISVTRLETDKTFLFTFVHDITDRKRIESVLRLASAYNRSLIEASMDPLVTIGPDGKITDVNAATEAVTGRARERLVGTDFSAYFTDPAKARAGYEQVFREGSVHDYALELRHRDGHVTSVLYNAAVYRDEAGQVAGVFAAARDITEQKRAAQRVAELAAIVESSDDAIISKNLDGIVTSWNRGAEVVYGYTEQDMIGRSISTLAPPGREDELLRILERIGRGEHIRRFETLRQRKDGRLINVSLTVSPIKNREGGIVGASTVARDITERKQAEEELRRANERLEMAQRASSAGMWDWDCATGRIEWSDTFFELFGLDPKVDLASFETWGLLVHPEDHQAALDRIDEALRNHTPLVSEYRIIRRDGEMRWINALGRSFHDPAGRPLRMAGICIDITERRRMETVLRENEERLRLALKATNDVVWDWDVVHDTQRWNEAGIAVFGWSDIVEHPQSATWWTNRVHPDDYQRVHDGFFAVVNNPSDSYWRDEYRFRKSDGSYALVLDRGYVMRDDQGRAVRMIGAMLDVTERKRAEEELRASQEHYRSLFDHMLDGYARCRMLFDNGRPVDFVYLEVNDAFERLTGLRDVAGKRVSQVIPGISESSPELFEAYGRVALSGHPERFEYYLRPLDMWLWISVFSVRKEEFIAVFDNITERKRAEKERVRLQEQILQIQKLDALGRMAAGIAHDFSNYLGVIRANSQSILKTVELDQKASDSFRMIQQAAEESLEVTRSLLTFSRGSPSPTQVVNLCDAIGSGRMLISQALPKNIKLETEFGCEFACPVRLDITQLHQLLLNLALNARDAMPEGGTLRIATAPCPAVQSADEERPATHSRRCAQIIVSDTGLGMPPETLGRIFEPFFTTKNRGKGSGLGLAIVHGLVESWGGHIEVESRPGLGTTFSITIPLEEAGEGVARNAAPSAARTGEGRTVLLVGIEPYPRSFIVPTLVAQGYSVVSVDVEDAIAGKPDGPEAVHLLILDAHRHGDEYAERLRTTLRRFSGIPAVILAARGHVLGAESSKSVTVVEEPYSLGEVVAAASHLLSKDEQEVSVS